MPPRDKKKSAGTLSPDDQVLWQSVARSVQPLDADLRQSDARSDTGGSAEEASGKPGSRRPAVKKAVGQDNFTPKRQPKLPPPAALDQIDRRSQRRINKGRINIDSTLDLHGLTQAQAFSRLRSHIEAACRDGQRCVLVITGKGSPASPGSGGGADKDRGILRRNLPDWLAGGALSGLVSAIAPAGRAHGGSGAFYLRLRKHS